MAKVRQNASDIWIGAGLVGFCGLAAWRTLFIKTGFSSSAAGPSFVPWLMIGAIFILSLVLILRGLRKLQSESDQPLVEWPEAKTLWTIGAFAALLVVYAAAFFPVGYIPATLVAAVLALFLIGERKVWVLVLFPTVMTFSVHYAFTNFLSVWLP